MKIGELFIAGFYGPTIPEWVGEFASRFGLGGVILFDYSCQTERYDNNIESPEQVRQLCSAIHDLPSRPMVFVDQEGGLVRRLKESRGFRPLPSAKDFNRLPLEEKRALLTASYDELRQLGFDYNFAPAIDIDENPDNPNIGRIKRSYSGDIREVEANAMLAGEVARQARIGLCLKHFPGIGGAVGFASAVHGDFRPACAGGAVLHAGPTDLRRCGPRQSRHRQGVEGRSADLAVT